MPEVDSCYALNLETVLGKKNPSLLWSLSLGKGQSQNQAHPVFQTDAAVSDIC